MEKLIGRYVIVDMDNTIIEVAKKRGKSFEAFCECLETSIDNHMITGPVTKYRDDDQDTVYQTEVLRLYPDTAEYDHELQTSHQIKYCESTCYNLDITEIIERGRIFFT